MGYDFTVPKQKPQLVRTMVRLEKSLHQQAKIQAVKEDLSLQDFVAKTIAEYLKRR